MIKRPKKIPIDSKIARTTALMAVLLADPKEINIDIKEERKRSDRYGSYIQLKTEIETDQPNDKNEIPQPNQFKDTPNENYFKINR